MTVSNWKVQPPVALALFLATMALALSIKNSPAPPNASGVQLTSDLGSAYVPQFGENGLVCYEIQGRTKGFIGLEYGTVKLMGKGKSSVSFEIFEPGCASVTATGAKALNVVKSSDFDGQLKVTVQKIKAKSGAGFIATPQNAGLEVRVAGIDRLAKLLCR